MPAIGSMMMRGRRAGIEIALPRGRSPRPRFCCAIRRRCSRLARRATTPCRLERAACRETPGGAPVLPRRTIPRRRPISSNSVGVDLVAKCPALSRMSLGRSVRIASAGFLAVSASWLSSMSSAVASESVHLAVFRLLARRLALPRSPGLVLAGIVCWPPWSRPRPSSLVFLILVAVLVRLVVRHLVGEFHDSDGSRSRTARAKGLLVVDRIVHLRRVARRLVLDPFAPQIGDQRPRLPAVGRPVSFSRTTSASASASGASSRSVTPMRLRLAQNRSSIFAARLSADAGHALSRRSIRRGPARPHRTPRARRPVRRAGELWMLIGLWQAERSASANRPMPRAMAGTSFRRSRFGGSGSCGPGCRRSPACRSRRPPRVRRPSPDDGAHAPGRPRA